MSETQQAVAVARMSDAALVDVSDGFCDLVGKAREELLGRTAADLGISNRDRLDWMISRFPERGRSHHQQRSSRRRGAVSSPTWTSTASRWAASGSSSR